MDSEADPTDQDMDFEAEAELEAEAEADQDPEQKFHPDVGLQMDSEVDPYHELDLYSAQRIEADSLQPETPR